MRQPAKNTLPLLTALALSTGLLAGCGSNDSPAGPSVTISAPGIVNPQAGSEVNDERPTLVITNVTVSGGSTPSYTFQVARDSGFAEAPRRGCSDWTHFPWEVVVVALEAGNTPERGA